MKSAVRDVVLEAVEISLDAQLRAVRRLRKGPVEPTAPRRKKRMSQVDMAYDILTAAQSPLHVGVILERIEQAFGDKVDRESLVSSLTKKVARGDRFIRTDRNTFARKEDVK